MEPTETIEFKDGAVLKIFPDEDPENPREWDNFGKMVCWHLRSNLGDEQVAMGDYSGSEAVREEIEEENDVAIILPLFLYEHSGMTMKTTPFYDPWDSGQVGWTYCTKQEVEDEFKGDIEAANSCLRGQVETYDRYL